jgi:hypothetical protein
VVSGVRTNWSCLALSAALLAGGCGFIGYDTLDRPCVGEGCSADRDPATGDAGSDGQGDGDGDAGGNPGDGDEDGDGRGDDGPDGGPNDPPGPHCGSMQALHEDFEAGQASVGWFERRYNGAALRHANGRLEMDLGGAPDAEARYRTSQVYDLRDSELAMELDPGGSFTGVALREGALERIDPPSPLRRGVALVVQGGMLRALLLDGAGEQSAAAIAYDAQAHHHVRLRERAGRIYWEASPDGRSWTTLHEQAVALAASALHVELFAGGASGDELAWFDNLNTPVASVPALCPPDGLRDDFADEGFALSWKRWFGAGTCSVEQAGGQLELELSGGAFAMCGLVSSRELDFRDATLSFELVGVPDDPAIAAFVDLSHYQRDREYTTDRVEVRVSAGRVFMRVAHKPSPEESDEYPFEVNAAYDPDAMRFWRLRERSGRFSWESSADAASWTVRAVTDTPFDVSRVVFGLSAVKTADATSAIIHYDNVAL